MSIYHYTDSSFFRNKFVPSQRNQNLIIMGNTSKLTLGQRNNNPLNIRYSKSNDWLGQTGSNRGFCTFSTIDYGFRAALILLRNYVSRGYTDIYSIVSRWAPSSENDTISYINFVSQYTGIRKHEQIKFMSAICRIVSAMAVFESRIVVPHTYLKEIAKHYDIYVFKSE